MSKTAELSRKDMKEPDRFQVVATQAAGWIGAHRQQVTLLGAAVVLVFVVVGAVSLIQSSRAEHAGTEGAALLAAVSADVSSIPLPGATGKTFPDEASKQKAIIAEAEKVLKDYPASPPAALALLAKGDAHFRLGEMEPAQKAYEQYLALTDPKDSLRFGALEGLALVAESRSDSDGAAAGWARLGKEAPEFADRAELEGARVLAKAGKKADAKKLLEGFGERHPTSFLTPQATKALGALAP
ncbi:MAG: hypothetical protein QM704_18720 [Anaeromyxobacteraceae bacterium]